MKHLFQNAKIISVNTDPDIYHRTGGERGQADFVMSRSELSNFWSCPSRWRAGYRQGDTDATEWGSLVDAMVLCGKTFDTEPETYPDAKTGEAKKWSNNATWCKEWHAKHPGSIKRKDADAAAQAVAALEADPNIAYLLANSEHQVLVMGEYLEAGTGLTIPVKALIDIVPGAQEDFYGATLADLKTCRSAGLRAWTRTVADGNLHWQAALYLDLYNAATGECRESFLHVLSESSAPYQTGRRILSLEFIEAGRLAYRTALSHYATCLKSARWPDYEGVGALNGWTFVEPEPWMVSLTLPPPPEEEEEAEETPDFVSEFPS